MIVIKKILFVSQVVKCKKKMVKEIKAGAIVPVFINNALNSVKNSLFVIKESYFWMDKEKFPRYQNF